MNGDDLDLDNVLDNYLTQLQTDVPGQPGAAAGMPGMMPDGLAGLGGAGLAGMAGMMQGGLPAGLLNPAGLYGGLQPSMLGLQAQQAAIICDGDDGECGAWDLDYYAQTARGNRAGDRIDQERHVVVDQRQPHPAAARLSAGRQELDRQIARLANRGHVGEKFGDFPALILLQILEIAGKDVGQEGVLE